MWDPDIKRAKGMCVGTGRFEESTVDDAAAAPVALELARCGELMNAKLAVVRDGPSTFQTLRGSEDAPKWSAFDEMDPDDDDEPFDDDDDDDDDFFEADDDDDDDIDDDDDGDDDFDLEEDLFGLCRVLAGIDRR